MLKMPICIHFITIFLLLVFYPSSSSSTNSPTLSPTTISSSVDYSCLHRSSWYMNNGHYNALFSQYTDTINLTYSAATNKISSHFFGIVNYDQNFTASMIATLNSRPLAFSDFVNKATTTAVAGNYYVWGSNIGYSQRSCSMGYWPPGPVCPVSTYKTKSFTLTPKQEIGSKGCFLQLGSAGTLVNGAALYSWSDAESYLNRGTWLKVAPSFEWYAFDVCYGHAANNEYHHHTYPSCLAAKLNDVGQGHSPVYGFALDGFPVYG